jgi:hypothetical protein
MATDRDAELAELVGFIANRYVRQKLSPASQINATTIRHWLGLSRQEILDVLDRHFDQSRRFYLSGSGDGLFGRVQDDIARALQAKHGRPAPEHKPKPEPQRRRSRVVKIPTASGVSDLFVDGPAASLVREPESNAQRPTGLPGYEADGEPIEDEAR